jgi:hypothetical protein
VLDLEELEIRASLKVTPFCWRAHSIVPCFPNHCHYPTSLKGKAISCNGPQDPMGLLCPFVTLVPCAPCSDHNGLPPAS